MWIRFRKVAIKRAMESGRITMDDLVGLGFVTDPITKKRYPYVNLELADMLIEEYRRNIENFQVLDESSVEDRCYSCYYFVSKGSRMFLRPVCNLGLIHLVAPLKTRCDKYRKGKISRAIAKAFSESYWSGE